MLKTNLHTRFLPILIAFVGLVVSTTVPAAQGAPGGRAEVHRIVRVSQTPAGLTAHQVVHFQLERAVWTLIDLLADSGVSIGTHTVSDDPDPTSDAPVRIPGDPGDEDDDGREGIVRLKNDGTQPPGPGIRPRVGTVVFGN